MAVNTLCSSATSSSTLPPTRSISSIPSVPTFKSHFAPQTHFPAKLELKLDSNDVFAIEEEKSETGTVAGAAMEIAIDDEKWRFWESGNGLERKRDDDGLEARRKRRRRRKGLESSEEETKMSDGQRAFSGSKSSGHLSSREEAQLSLCIKEEARIEAAKKRIMESQESEPTTEELAKAVGMKARSIDKTFCKGRESQERIIRCYRRLVVSIASGYQDKGLSIQDLIQEGSIGLLRGAERFDQERGHKLSTYVYWWIKQAIIRAVDGKSRLVRLPGNMCQVAAKIAETNSALRKQLRRMPTHGEIAKELNINVAKVRLVSERSKHPFSLNQAITDRGSMTLQDIMPGPEELVPEKMVEEQLKKQEVERLLNTLCKREAQVVRLYFGFDGQIPRSFEEIGKVLNLSRERVRQINGIALSKLRQTSMTDYLKVFIL